MMRGLAIAAAYHRLHRALCRGVAERHQFLLPAGDDAGSGLGDLRPVVEPAQRLHRPDLVRSRRLLRRRRLCRRARPGLFRPVAVGHDPDRRRARRHRRTADRLSDLPPAGPLLRAGDARLPARHSLRVRMARPSGSDAADQARQSDRLYAVRRSPSLHAAGAGDDARHDPADAGGRAVALRHGAARDQAERGRGGSCGDQHAGLEAPRHHAQRRHRRRGWRILRGRAAGGDAAIRVRHAGVGTGADGRHVRRRRNGLGSGDRIGDPDPVGRNAATPKRARAFPAFRA